MPSGPDPRCSTGLRIVRRRLARSKFVFATDGSYFEAEDVAGAQEPVADFLTNLANHFGFFLPLAGISTVREIKDNPIDVRATGDSTSSTWNCCGPTRSGAPRRGAMT